MEKHVLTILSLSLSIGFSPLCAQLKNNTDDISVSRNVSATQYGDHGQPIVTISIIINKNATGGHAFVEEDFSNDLRATLIKNNGAKFQSDSGKVLFEWVNIPYDREVTVSYQLEAVNKTPDDKTVSGQFLYKKLIYPITPSSFSLKVVNGEPKPILISKNDTVSNNNPVISNPASISGGLIYRIQIAAVPDKTKVPELLKQYNITEEPYLETAGANIIRVLIGNYPTLSSAKSRIDELKSKGLTGAFVAPYYKGKRTNLQEAAMHSRQ